MLKDAVQIVSVDDHVIEHPDVWVDRVPREYADRAPRIEDTPDGSCVWRFDGRRYPQLGLNAVAGKDPKDLGTEPNRFSDMLPGCYDIKARIADMDTDGVQAQLCFPSFPGFAGRTFYEAPDKDLSLVCVRAWNDFMIDEWCGYDSARQIPLIILPYWDVEACVAEIVRAAAKGARAISFNERPSDAGLPSFHTHHWDPVFQAAQDFEMPICMHFGSSGVTQMGGGVAAGAAAFLTDGAPLAVGITLMAHNSMRAAVDLIFSHTFESFPNLRVLLAEGGIGWIPYILERADYTWERHRWSQGLSLTTKPSEVFADHLFGCFISDEAGLEQRDKIGVGQIMWEGDYPHADSNWPYSRQRLTEQMEHVRDDEVELILEGTARRLFRFPRGEKCSAS